MAYDDGRNDILSETDDDVDMAHIVDSGDQAGSDRLDDTYKVWVLAAGESTFATNGVVFGSVKDANTWGGDLMMRWSGAIGFYVLPDRPEFTGFLTLEIMDANRVAL